MSSIQAETPEKIREEIDRTRLQMNEKLDYLERKLHPKKWMDQIMYYFTRPNGNSADELKYNVQQAGRTISNQVRENPVPAILIGAGVGWWLYNQYGTPSHPKEKTREWRDRAREGWEYSKSRARETAEDMRERARETGEDLRERARDTGEDLRDRARETGEDLRDRAYDKGREYKARMEDTGRRAAERAKDEAYYAKERLEDTAREGYKKAQSGVEEAFHKNPLGVGLGFLAVGALAGMLLPKSRVEDEWCGETSDRVKKNVIEQTSEAACKGIHSAEKNLKAHMDRASQDA
jgi:ElaB/YqjD/DUF883 family membrane-anchored ribosome-binding protein